ncbi:sigma-70 family RNA polymerase sigma factor [Actinophytocola gossypii]|uniref:Sigma-70 family RNA polymerase sigma factor n=1 Tax=Actinophytocola gossypii TaxID=2812003 RepID=A0ABT2J8M4_9PSEU|nr:sigma-70 family RNA polymerase sigma factor [Actinophytocola gossypii]MCT2584213.1 sigma-70 family RNA polymerase sigma factor [Actinophytocola gossypii]
MAETLEEMPDAELIASVRQGDVAAFGELYARHLDSAKRAAAYLARTQAEREDLVAEAFTRVLRMLREGRGPDAEFRPYLLVTLRNAAIQGSTRGAPVALYAELPDTYVTEEYVDPVVERWHAGVAAEAFASLPERWRMVLWHTEVEDESPAVVAPRLGMRPNSVAALAYRAREGLRQAYLRQHVPGPLRRECAATVDKLAGYVRRSVPPPLSRKITRHLDRCADCRGRVDTLTKVNAELAGVFGPLAVGVPLAAGATAAESGLSGVLLMKVGAAVAIAATAVTTSASAPAIVAEPHPPTAVIAEVTGGEHGSTFTVEPRPPVPTPAPAAATATTPAPARTPAPATAPVPARAPVSPSPTPATTVALPTRSAATPAAQTNKGNEQSEKQATKPDSSQQKQANSEAKTAKKQAKAADKEARKATKKEQRAAKKEQKGGK